jgi:hypothetical protein
MPEASDRRPWECGLPYPLLLVDLDR